MLFSCNRADSQSEDKRKEEILKEARMEVQACMDSANNYFELLIQQHGDGKEKLDDTELAKIKELEEKINQILKKKVNQLSEERRITEHELDVWIKKTQSQQLLEIYDSLKKAYPDNFAP